MKRFKAPAIKCVSMMRKMESSTKMYETWEHETLNEDMQHKVDGRIKGITSGDKNHQWSLLNILRFDLVRQLFSTTV